MLSFLSLSWVMGSNHSKAGGNAALPHMLLYLVAGPTGGVGDNLSLITLITIITRHNEAGWLDRGSDLVAGSRA